MSSGSPAAKRRRTLPRKPPVVPQFSEGELVLVADLPVNLKKKEFVIQYKIREDGTWLYRIDATDFLGPNCSMNIPEDRLFKIAHPIGTELVFKLGGDQVGPGGTAKVHDFEFLNGKLVYTMDVGEVQRLLPAETVLNLEGLGAVKGFFTHAEMRYDQTLQHDIVLHYSVGRVKVALEDLA